VLSSVQFNEIPTEFRLSAKVLAPAGDKYNNVERLFFAGMDFLSPVNQWPEPSTFKQRIMGMSLKESPPRGGFYHFIYSRAGAGGAWK
jgi:hypothetical protein